MQVQSVPLRLACSWGWPILRWEVLSSFDNLGTCSFGSASLRGGGPRAPRPRKGPEFFCLSLVNTTSLSPHWRMLSEAQADVLVVTETHATEFEQASIGVGLKYKGWTPYWSLPVAQGPSGAMSGRSGGTAVWLRALWVASTVMGLELEVTQQCYQAPHLHNPETQATFLLIAYYGRPQQRDVTLRDHQRIMEFCASMNEDAILAGDFNINDGDPHALPLSDELVDAAWWSSGVCGPEPTCYVGALASRLDRVYVSPSLLEHQHSCSVNSDLHVPGHMALSLKLRLRSVKVFRQVAAEPLRYHVPDSTSRQNHEAVAIAEWDALISDGLENILIDDLYVKWSGIWEKYLRNLAQKRGPQTRGVVRPPVQTWQAPLRARYSHSLRRMCRFLNDLRQLHNANLNGRSGSKPLWDRVRRAALVLSELYGVPELGVPENPDPVNIIQYSLEEMIKFYSAVLKEEKQKSYVEKRQTFRSKVNAHAGVNRMVSRILKGSGAPVAPKVLASDGSVLPPAAAVDEVQRAWMEYYAKPSLDPEAAIFEELERDPWQQSLPPITAQDILGILRKKGHQTAPLALIFGIMEERGQAPSSMVAGWLADLAKSEAPAPPIAVRPIPILSIVWRVYTSARAHDLQEWAKEAFAKSQYAYIAGRDYQRALVDLQLLMDTVRADPVAQLHVLSLDASKAFPSTPHAYMWRTLVSRGFPAKVAFVVEDAYSKGVLRHRFNGSNVASSSFFMVNGIHQGCATSVLGFNAILVEMCEAVLALHPSLRIMVYADDISLISSDRDLLLPALAIVEAHMLKLGVSLNGAKSQYWSARGAQPIWVSGASVPPQPVIKVLGFQLSCTPLVHVGQDHPLQQVYHTAAQTLRKLPMTAQFRANALAGITLARELWAPLRVLVDGRLAGHIRKHIIAGVAPYLAKGARASAMVCIHCLKGHRIDPVVALVMKLVSLLAKGGEPSARRVLGAYHREEVVATPFSLLAHYFRM